MTRYLISLVLRLAFVVVIGVISGNVITQTSSPSWLIVPPMVVAYAIGQIIYAQFFEIEENA